MVVKKENADLSVNSLAIPLASKNDSKMHDYIFLNRIAVSEYTVLCSALAREWSTPFPALCKHGYWDTVQEDCVVEWRSQPLHTVCPALEHHVAQLHTRTCRSGYQKAARNFDETDLDVDISRCVAES